MSKFEHLRVGDTVIREMDGFRDQLWQYSGKVIAIDETVITAQFIVDQPRTMKFSRETGIDILGKEFGWLEDG